MGLDTYAMFPKEHESYYEGGVNTLPNEWFNHTLCGGMLSGDGSSFRGKVYNDYVHFVTGESLYQEEIPADRVKRMAEMLAKPGVFDKYQRARHDPYITEDQAVMLAEWFKVVADNNSVVVGWW